MKHRSRRVIAVIAVLGLTLTASHGETFHIPEIGHGLPGIVEVAGDLLLIRQPTGFVVLSLADPSRPVPVGEFAGAARTRDLGVDGSLVLLIEPGPELAGDLVVVSLADPTHPVEVSRLPIGYSAHVALAAEPSGAWTVDGDALSLHHIDLGDPERPVEDAFHYNTQAWDIRSWRGHLIVVGPIMGLAVREVGSEGSLTPVGDVPLWANPNGIAVRGGLAAVRMMTPWIGSWGGSERLGLVDLGDPEEPELLHLWPESTDDFYVDLAFGCRRLIVASHQQGVAFVDLRNPRRPGPLEFTELDSPPVAVDAGRGHAYVLTADGRLVVLPIPGCWREPIRRPTPVD